MVYGLFSNCKLDEIRRVAKEEMRADIQGALDLADLVVTVVNACYAINPKDPMKVATNLELLYRIIGDLEEQWKGVTCIEGGSFRIERLFDLTRILSGRE